jgi:hypothetical protein
MHRLLRLFLAAFLALAVPLQGLAGVTMSACAMAHGQEAAMHAVAHDHGAMEADSGHHGEGHAPAGDEHQAHNCAACAACCSLSAAPANALALASAAPAPSVAIPFVEVRHASVQPAGLERPPSTVLLG